MVFWLNYLLYAFPTRTLGTSEAIQNNIVPPLIKNENRDKYLKAINDKDNLYKFLESGIKKSMELISK